jgi:hypothetical protein
MKHYNNREHAQAQKKKKKKSQPCELKANTLEQINLELDYSSHATILQLANSRLHSIKKQGKPRFQFSFLLQTHLLKYAKKKESRFLFIFHIYNSYIFSATKETIIKLKIHIS